MEGKKKRIFPLQDMARVDVCPKNLTKVIESSKKLRCGNDDYGNNQYLCLPNVNKTSLVEFCYNGTMGFQEKGIFLFTFFFLIQFNVM